jgi:hypothetical protein
LACRL